MRLVLDQSPSSIRPRMALPRRAWITPVLTEDNSDRAIALNSTLLVTGPFSLTTSPNFSTDQRTRILLFVEGLEFVQGGPLPLVSVRAVNGQQNQFQLPLEVIAFNSRLPFTQ